MWELFLPHPTYIVYTWLYMLNTWNVNTYVYTDKRLNTAHSDWKTTDPTSRQRERPVNYDSNCQTVTNIWSWAPEVTRHQDTLTDWPSVVMWLRLWLFSVSRECELVAAASRRLVGGVSARLRAYQDRLCGLVVRVPGYRSIGPGSIPGATRFSEK
jgi:hypothetical protein